MNHIECFAERFKELLEINGTEVKTVAQAMRIHSSGCYSFLDGKHVPSTKNAIKIASFFKCSLDYLFGFCDETDDRPCEYTAPFSERFQKILKDKNLSRYELSQKAEICEQTLWRWYHGKQRPSLSSIVILAEHLECSVDYLAGRVLL